MKKAGLFLFAGVLLFMVSCNNKPKTEVAEVGEAVIVTDSITQPDESNARTSLDYAGSYKGVLPAADAEGMDVVIVLTDSTYTKTIKYLGKKDSKATTTKGKYSWTPNGSVIILEGEDKPNEYFVQEGSLRQLDTNGNKIEGSLAEAYVLKKQ